MIRKAERKDIAAIGETYTELLTHEKKHGGFSNWELGVYPTVRVAEEKVPCGEMFVLEEDGRFARAWYSTATRRKNMRRYRGSMKPHPRRCSSSTRSASRRSRRAGVMARRWSRMPKNTQLLMDARSSASIRTRTTSPSNNFIRRTASALQDGERSSCKGSLMKTRSIWNVGWDKGE